MTYQIVLLVIGILFLLLCLFGRVESDHIKVGSDSKLVRAISGLFGAALIGLSLYLFLKPPVKVPPISDPPIPITSQKCETEYTDSDDNSGIYSGQCQNDVPHGEGQVNYHNGDFYSGSFVEGKESGNGAYRWAHNNDRYVGEWLDGEMNGKGTYFFANGDRYVGEWRDSEKSGVGTYHFANGDRYEGEWRDNRKNGEGTFSYGNGDRYEGAWRDNVITGQGTYQYDDGRRYVGEWLDNERNGLGTFHYANGDRYEGAWRDNNRNGEGTHNLRNGNRQVGYFRNDTFWDGQFIFADGTVCEVRNQESVKHGCVSSD